MDFIFHMNLNQQLTELSYTVLKNCIRQTILVGYNRNLVSTMEAYIVK